MEPTATPEPTNIPATPTVMPITPAPAAPRASEATVTCDPLKVDEGTPASTPSAARDIGNWTLLDCAVNLDISGWDRVVVRGISDSIGWRLILVEEDAPDTPGLLDASNDLVELEAVPGEPDIRFLLGYQLSCSALPSTRIAFDITGSTNSEPQFTATAELTLREAARTAPNVFIESVWIDAERNPEPTSLRIAWTDAPTACPWTITTTLDSGAWSLVGYNGPEGSAALLEGITIVTRIPSGVESSGASVFTLVPTNGNDTPIRIVQVEAFTWP